MQPSTSLSRSKLLMATGLCSVLIYGCASGGGTPATTATGGQPGTGTSTGGSGTGTPGTGGSTTFGSGGNGSPSGSTGGSGTGNNNGTPGTGGSGTNASGGSGFPTSGTGGNPGTSGGTGGSGQGGTVAPASGGAGGGLARACPVASPDVISDFEDGSAVMVKQGGRTGWWSTYYPGSPAALMAGMMQTPPHLDGPVAVAADPAATNPMCNKALHTTGSGFGTAPNNYAGVSAGFVPMAPPSMIKTAYDVSAYTGISFKIKSGTATPPPAVFFELLTKDNQPATAGGTATVTTIDLYNSRGQMLNAPWSPAITPTWQTIYVPFGTLIPRWLPAQASGACPAAGAGVPKCQAPKFNPASALGIQISMYQDPGFPKPTGSTAGTYDLWMDDVEFIKGDMGLPTLPGFPNDGAVGSCTKPTQAAGKFLVPAYQRWKENFVVAAGGGFRVQRPENGNDTVSEGIGYGMLIAVYMNDKALFDGLWTYWKSMADSTSPDGPLMKWNTTGGVGTATDADEDAAFAMLQASKKWAGMGTYAGDAQNLMHAVFAHDMAGSYIKGGSMYGATDVTNPSYFAPAWYREFAKADTANGAAWTSLANGAYSLLAAIGGSSSNGLYPAWCTGGSCSAPATNKGSAVPAEDVIYQYDAHRIPWRIGTDYCWNSTAAAKTYLTDKIIKFFATSASAGLNGIGRIADKYTPSNGNAASVVVNSASIIGTAAVGAMSDPQFKTFLDDGYQLVFDLLTRGAILGDPKDGTKSAYSYYNATVGMLTLLSMTGNLRPL